MLKPEDVGSKLVNGIKDRLHFKNKNWLCVVCGETGSGKSYSAISFGSMIGRTFIVFTPLEFLELLNSGKLKKGDVIVFDEAGVGLSAREWQSVQNKLMGSVLQTFRHMNIAVIFTVPNLSFVDVQARKLFHMIMETQSIDYETNLAKLRLYNIQVNNRSDGIYYKNPRIRDENGMMFQVTHIDIPLPEKKMIDYYEDKKQKYTSWLNKKALSDLKKDYASMEVKPKVNEEGIVKDILANKDKYVKTKGTRNFFDVSLIRNDYNLSVETSKKIKKVADRMAFER